MCWPVCFNVLLEFTVTSDVLQVCRESVPCQRSAERKKNDLTYLLVRTRGRISCLGIALSLSFPLSPLFSLYEPVSNSYAYAWGFRTNAAAYEIYENKSIWNPQVVCPMTYSQSPRFVNFDTTGELLVDVDMDKILSISKSVKAIILTQTARTSSSMDMDKTDFIHIHIDGGVILAQPASIWSMWTWIKFYPYPHQ